MCHICGCLFPYSRLTCPGVHLLNDSWEKLQPHCRSWIRVKKNEWMALSSLLNKNIDVKYARPVLFSSFSIHGGRKHGVFSIVLALRHIVSSKIQAEKTHKT